MSRLITLILVNPNLFVLKVVVIFFTSNFPLISRANSENTWATALPFKKRQKQNKEKSEVMKAYLGQLLEP